jgi:excisionase family DNA binding protein
MQVASNVVPDQAGRPTPLLNKPEAARLLGVSERTIDNMRARGEIRSVVVSKRRVLFDPNDLRAYIEAQKNLRVAPAPAPESGENRP